MDNILLSIIVPCYNHGKYIKETLQSIKECKAVCCSYEVIIINDGSTDEYTKQVLNEISGPELIVLHQHNQGLGAARNNGISVAKGKYILPLDSDNLVFAPYLSTAIKILEKDEAIAVVYGDADYFGEKTGVWHVGEYNLQKLMLGNYIDACAVYRRQVWQKTGGYATNMPFMGFEDWDFWLKLSFAGEKFYYLKEVSFGYRVLNQSMLQALNSQKSTQLKEYLSQKYTSYLSISHINTFFVKSFSQNKKLFFKLFLAVFFPKYLNRLYQKGRIKNKGIL